MIWLLDNPDPFWSLLAEHTVLSVLPTVLGLLLALPVGAALRGRPRARALAVLIAGILFTIPSLALFVVLPGILGTRILDPLNVVLALTLYALALLVRAVLDSLDGVPVAGYAPARRIAAVELPIALPVLIPALRVVLVTNVSLVSVGAVIGIGGLGQLFTAGYQRSYPDQILAGIIGTVVLALVLDRVLALLGRSLTRWDRAGRTAA